MPAKNPRIQVVLSPELYEAIGEIARLSDTSRSGFVSTILYQNAETIIQLSHLLRQARDVAGTIPLSTKVKIDSLLAQIEGAEDTVRSALDDVQTSLPDGQRGQSSEGVGALARPRTRSVGPLAINKGANMSSSGDFPMGSDTLKGGK